VQCSAKLVVSKHGLLFIFIYYALLDTSEVGANVGLTLTGVGLYLAQSVATWLLSLSIITVALESRQS